MRRSFGLSVAAALAVTATGVSPKGVIYAQQVAPKPLPKYDTDRAALPALSDEAHLLLTHLTNDNDGTQLADNVSSEDVDVFEGASALRVTPIQRHARRIPGWSFPIAENPAEGQYRYVRFAWKKVGGEGVMVQISDQNRSWVARYHAGKNVQNWQPSTEVAKEVPAEWTVVTRDLFKDYGPMTVTGMAFTAFDGQYALFDHVVFGRTVADLDAATAAALGKTEARGAIEPRYREALWENLFDRDREKAGLAVREFLTAAEESVSFIADRLPQTDQSPEEVRNRAKRIETLMGQLGHQTDFDVRVAAEKELEKIGPAAEPVIRAALQSPDAEVRYRAERLLGKMKLEDGEASLAAACAGRVVRILERANTTDAKALLKSMTEGLYGAEYLDPAAAALARLK